MKYVLLFTLFLISLNSLCQDGIRILIDGQVTDYYSGKGVKGSILTLYENGVMVSKIKSTRGGNWWFNLKPEQFYILEASRDFYVSKKFIIDTRKIDKSEDYSIYLQISLFIWIEGIDFSFFDHPVSWCKYNRSIRNMSWDTDFTKDRMKTYENIMKEYKKLYVGYYQRNKKSSKKITFSTPEYK